MSTPPPDLILTGAEIFTDGVVPGWAEAMAVSGGQITAVGDSASVLELAAPGPTCANWMAARCSRASSTRMCTR